VLRALALFGRMERGSFMQAGELLRRAIEMEPDHIPAHAWLAYWQLLAVDQAWTRDSKAAMAEAGRLAERAVMLDPQDAKALCIAGHVRASMHHRLREALALHERALRLNPNLTMGWSLSGLACAYLGDLDEAGRRLQRYKTLAPLDPHAFMLDLGLIVVALLRQDFEAAVAAGRSAVEMQPSFVPAYKPYLAALGHLRQAGEVERIRQRLLALEPGFSLQRSREANLFERPEHQELFAAGLRLAGIKE
jgi:tetratricopeptide (TPR) repeat protein